MLMQTIKDGNKYKTKRSKKQQVKAIRAIIMKKNEI